VARFEGANIMKEPSAALWIRTVSPTLSGKYSVGWFCSHT